jgi:tetratricopeptide (TPR) repeat protein
MKRKQKSEVPVDLAARVLFKSDRTCCVCRTAGKPVQLHHVDEDPGNSVERNLAVLCFDCHTDTQIKGGFHRKLDCDQVILYRDDWNQIVAQRRATIDAQSIVGAAERAPELKSLTTTLEILRERGQYFLLVVHYDALGNNELRDKYIELALQQEPDDDDLLIFLRSIQSRQDLIPQEVIDREIQRRQEHSSWSHLARLYDKIGEHKNAVRNYCKTILEALDEERDFSAAFYLKELGETELQQRLFENAYRKSTEAGDLWWRIRALQELGWKDELKAVLIENRVEIERSGNSFLREQLFHATGETDKLHEERRARADGIRVESFD